MAQEENYIIQRFKQGEKQAFEEIMDKVYPSVYLYTMRLAGNSGRAEEIIKQSFVKAFTIIKYLHTCSIEDFKNYLYIMIRQACFNLYEQTYDLISLPDLDSQFSIEEKAAIARDEIIAGVLIAIKENDSTTTR